MLPKIHFVENMDHIRRLDKEANLWESRWWAVSPETAEKLVGGRIFFHKAQKKPSFFGGDITGFRVETGDEWRGRIIFKFKASEECRGITTGPEGWGREKKIVL
ncbi:MAG: hypothetical protein LBS70_06380 [Candidatus Accumulibacter sp.]|jgi:hypothetical protein|nr:hypothetical protein [Accumulibacter sp.]